MQGKLTREEANTHIAPNMVSVIKTSSSATAESSAVHNPKVAQSLWKNW